MEYLPILSAHYPGINQPEMAVMLVIGSEAEGLFISDPINLSTKDEFHGVVFHEFSNNKYEEK